MGQQKNTNYETGLMNYDYIGLQRQQRLYSSHITKHYLSCNIQKKAVAALATNNVVIFFKWLKLDSSKITQHV